MRYCSRGALSPRRPSTQPFLYRLFPVNLRVWTTRPARILIRPISTQSRGKSYSCYCRPAASQTCSHPCKSLFAKGERKRSSSPDQQRSWSAKMAKQTKKQNYQEYQSLYVLVAWTLFLAPTIRCRFVVAADFGAGRLGLRVLFLFVFSPAHACGAVPKRGR